MKSVFGIILIVAGAALGIYVGLGVCFIGGIVDVIQQIRAENLVALSVAWGIAKIFLAGVLGWLSGAVLIIPGLVMVKD